MKLLCVVAKKKFHLAVCGKFHAQPLYYEGGFSNERSLCKIAGVTTISTIS